MAILQQPKQRLVVQTEHRTAEDAGQAHLVARAIERSQQVQQVVDFLLGVEGVAADEIVGDLVASQGLFVVFDVRQRTEQEGEIAGTGGSGRWLARWPLRSSQTSISPESSMLRMRRAIQSASRRRSRSLGPMSSEVRRGGEAEGTRGEYFGSLHLLRRCFHLPPSAFRPFFTAGPEELDGGRGADLRTTRDKAARSLGPNSSLNRALTKSRMAGWLRKFSVRRQPPLCRNFLREDAEHAVDRPRGNGRSTA